jgi:putative acetyltransferase
LNAFFKHFNLERKATIRRITPGDDPALASIIRRTLEEYNAVKPGTVYFDETTDHLYDVFQSEKSCYFIVEANGQIYGGAGIFPTKDLPANTCELVKMYLVPNARGKGIGQMLLEKCIEKAKNEGFEKMYLESMPELVNAIAMYKRNGFTFLTGPLGNSGHSGCNIFMIKQL